ncbi:MAG: tetratricopeptide repeat protein [Alphaproteobacteria bacterium]
MDTEIEALFQKGVAAFGTGNLDAAADQFRRTLDQNPDHAGALANLALIQRRRGALDEAHALLIRAAARPDATGEVFFNLANLVHQMGRLDEAVAALRTAVTRSPQLGRAQLKLALMLLEAGGDHAEILAAARAAARHLADDDPAFAKGDALLRVFPVLWAANCWDESIRILKGLSRARPQALDIHFRLGSCLAQAAHYGEAIENFRKVLAVRSDQIDARIQIANCLVNMGRAEEAEPLFAGIMDHREGRAKAFSSYLMTMLYTEHHSDAEILKAHEDLTTEFSAGKAPVTLTRPPGESLRVGYVTADFKLSHPVAQFMAPVLAAHKDKGVEQVIYLNADRIDNTVPHLEDMVRLEKIKGVADEALARRIAGDGIDILIDLSGQTSANRQTLFAHRPAPISATMIGYPHSSGNRAIDWLISDGVLYPDGEEPAATETVIRLPHSFLCFAAPADFPAFTGNHPSGPVVFGSLNALPKLGRPTVEAWAGVMAGVPEARLLIKCGAFAGAGVREDMARRFAEHGVARERLILEGPEVFTEAMRAYERIDIALDPTPYNGGTTTAHALWQGVPLVTLKGTRSCARMGASLLTAAGHPEWIGADRDGFVAIARALAADVERLRAERRALHEQVTASPLCDVEAYADALFDIYRRIRAAG